MTSDPPERPSSSTDETEDLSRRMAVIRVSDDPRTPHITVLTGARLGLHLNLSRTVLIGRDPSSDIVLHTKGTSRRHARIEPTCTGVVLLDLDSKNGVFVNGVRVNCVNLADGDRIQIGQTILKFSLPDPLEERLQWHLYEAAVRDGLTGLYNKRFFWDRLEAEHAKSTRHGLPLSVLIFDLDHFKRVNDEFGHQAGDKVLVDVARLAQAQLRSEDVFARFGGEEFVVILPHTAINKAVSVAERIRTQIAAHRFPSRSDGREIPVTVSIGVAMLVHALPAAGLVSLADACLYRAKARGRNRVVVVGDP